MLCLEMGNRTSFKIFRELLVTTEAQGVVEYVAMCALVVMLVYAAVSLAKGLPIAPWHRVKQEMNDVSAEMSISTVENIPAGP